VRAGALAGRVGALGNYYLPSGSPLINAGSATAGQFGLSHYTTQASQVKEADSIVTSATITSPWMRRQPY